MHTLRAILCLALTVLACGPRKEKSDRDVERTDFPPLESNTCEAAIVLDPAALYEGLLQLSSAVPAAGTTAAFEGVPQALVACTRRGCKGECCYNDCWGVEGCAYFLDAGGSNRLCLMHDGWQCGGTDCSPWCEPFSTTPTHRYRFVGTLAYNSGRASLAVTAVCRLD